MSRRPDPQRIDQAREATLRSRLASAGITDERVDEWIEAWQQRANIQRADRVRDYWTQAWDWITAERDAGRRP